MKRFKAPSHQTLIKPYLKDKRFREKIEAGVQRLKVINQIVELREKLHLTQAELAHRIGVSQPFIARIESDEASNLTLETLIKIIDALNGEIEIRIRPRKKAA
jgi:DNA-binding XRE family transcriptional regulator